MKTRFVAVLAALGVMAAVPYAVARATHRPPPAAAPLTATSRALRASPVAVAPGRYAGIVTDNLGAFDRACGCHPDMAVHYPPVGGSTSMTLPRLILAAGAVPLLELEPYGVPLTSITAGREDRWLTRYADAVHTLGAPVFVSFGPEANGTWYSWGYRHVSPALFVAAWRHVVRVFRKAGAVNARWVWIMNVSYSHTEDIRLLWPGASFVNILGIDGYFRRPADSFAGLFAATIAQMRSFSTDPVLITETAASPSAGKLHAVNQLVAGVRRYRLAGFVWFDVYQHGSYVRQDWQLEPVPAALAAYRNATKTLH